LSGSTVSRARLSTGLSAFYGTYFGTVGVALPFMPVWLAWRGLDPTEIGIVLGASFWIRVIALPLVASYADRSGRRRPLMRVLPLVALAAYAGLAFVSGVLAFAALALVIGASFSALVPLGESLALRGGETHGVDYGRVRLWGSVGFIVGSMGAGLLLSGAAPSWILPAIIAAVVLTTGACAALPDLPRERPPARLGSALRLFTRPVFLLFLAACGTVQASHVTYYGFGSIHWAAAGHSEGVVGALWAEGVIAEVLLFLLGTRLTARLRPFTLIALSGLAGVLRWSVLASTTDLAALVFVQALHAVTFGAAHLGAMAWLRQNVPEELRTTATSLYAATIAGVAFGATMPAAGALYETHGGGAFYFGVVLSAAGLLLAAAAGRLRGPTVPGGAHGRAPLRTR